MSTTNNSSTADTFCKGIALVGGLGFTVFQLLNLFENTCGDPCINRNKMNKRDENSARIVVTGLGLAVIGVTVFGK